MIRDLICHQCNDHVGIELSDDISYADEMALRKSLVCRVCGGGDFYPDHSKNLYRGITMFCNQDHKREMPRKITRDEWRAAEKKGHQLCKNPDEALSICESAKWKLERERKKKIEDHFLSAVEDINAGRSFVREVDDLLAKNAQESR